MTLSWALLIIFIVLLFASILFAGLPKSDAITWTPRRESLMYKTSFWSFILAMAAVILSLLAFAKSW